MATGRKMPVVRDDGKRYPTVRAAADDVYGAQSNISRACRMPWTTAYGYKWRYAEELGNEKGKGNR